MDIRHIAFIPDGNRRYAKKLGIPYSKAYEAGFNKTKEIITEWQDIFKKYGVNQLTFWALSTENLKRSKEELGIIFRYMEKLLSDSLRDDEVEKYGFSVRFVGRLGLLPSKLVNLMRDVEERTREYSDFVVNIAVAYGGRAEILDAVSRLISSGLSVNEDNLSRFLYIPDSPDLIVRTSGTIRTSGFMPWQATYSEWHFSKKLWPEFDRDDMLYAIDDYLSRRRNFGL